MDTHWFNSIEDERKLTTSGSFLMVSGTQFIALFLFCINTLYTKVSFPMVLYKVMTAQLNAIPIPTDLGVEQVVIVLLCTIVGTILVTELSHTVTVATPEINWYLECLRNFQGLLRDIFFHTPVHPAFSLDNLDNFTHLTRFLNQAARNLVAIQMDIQIDHTASLPLQGYITSCLESRMAFDILSENLHGYTELLDSLSSLQ